MPACLIDATASPEFQKLVATLRKDYANIDRDLADAFNAIRQDPWHAKHANRMPGFDFPVLKHRQNSSDIRRGATYGFRIVA